MKILILALSLFAVVGCSSFASNPNACREAPPLLPLPYIVAGNVFQFSPCTSIEPLRIETGVELDYIRSGVTRALDSNFIIVRKITKTNPVLIEGCWKKE